MGDINHGYRSDIRATQNDDSLNTSKYKELVNIFTGKDRDYWTWEQRLEGLRNFDYNSLSSDPAERADIIESVRADLADYAQSGYLNRAIDKGSVQLENVHSALGELGERIEDYEREAFRQRSLEYQDSLESLDLRNGRERRSIFSSIFERAVTVSSSVRDYVSNIFGNDFKDQAGRVFKYGGGALAATFLGSLIFGGDDAVGSEAAKAKALSIFSGSKDKQEIVLTQEEMSELEGEEKIREAYERLREHMVYEDREPEGASDLAKVDIDPLKENSDTRESDHVEYSNMDDPWAKVLPDDHSVLAEEKREDIPDVDEVDIKPLEQGSYVSSQGDISDDSDDLWQVVVPEGYNEDEKSPGRSSESVLFARAGDSSEPTEPSVRMDVDLGWHNSPRDIFKKTPIKQYDDSNLSESVRRARDLVREAAEYYRLNRDYTALEKLREAKELYPDVDDRILDVGDGTDYEYDGEFNEDDTPLSELIRADVEGAEDRLEQARDYLDEGNRCRAWLCTYDALRRNREVKDEVRKVRKDCGEILLVLPYSFLGDPAGYLDKLVDNGVIDSYDDGENPTTLRGSLLYTGENLRMSAREFMSLGRGKPKNIGESVNYTGENAVKSGKSLISGVWGLVDAVAPDEIFTGDRYFEGWGDSFVKIYDSGAHLWKTGEGAVGTVVRAPAEMSGLAVSVFDGDAGEDVGRFANEIVDVPMAPIHGVFDVGLTLRDPKKGGFGNFDAWGKGLRTISGGVRSVEGGGMVLWNGTARQIAWGGGYLLAGEKGKCVGHSIANGPQYALNIAADIFPFGDAEPQKFQSRLVYELGEGVNIFEDDSINHIDVNRDGRITTGEFISSLPLIQQLTYARYDADRTVTESAVETLTELKLLYDIFGHDGGSGDGNGHVIEECTPVQRDGGPGRSNITRVGGPGRPR